jgi:acyl-CoA hydrolase
MDFQSMYKSKFTTVEGAISKLKSNDIIYSAGATAEPLTFLRNLKHLKGKVNNLTLHLNLALENNDIYSNEEYRDLINVQASFFPRFYSPLQKIGRSTYMPTHLRNMGSDPLIITNV